MKQSIRKKINQLLPNIVNNENFSSEKTTTIFTDYITRRYKKNDNLKSIGVNSIDDEKTQTLFIPRTINLKFGNQDFIPKNVRMTQKLNNKTINKTFIPKLYNELNNDSNKEINNSKIKRNRIFISSLEYGNPKINDFFAKKKLKSRTIYDINKKETIKSLKSKTYDSKNRNIINKSKNKRNYDYKNQFNSIIGFIDNKTKISTKQLLKKEPFKIESFFIKKDYAKYLEKSEKLLTSEKEIKVIDKNIKLLGALFEYLNICCYKMGNLQRKNIKECIKISENIKNKNMSNKLAEHYKKKNLLTLNDLCNMDKLFEYRKAKKGKISFKKRIFSLSKNSQFFSEK
jgi:hypothetical protein